MGLIKQFNVETEPLFGYQMDDMIELSRVIAEEVTPTSDLQSIDYAFQRFFMNKGYFLELKQMEGGGCHGQSSYDVMGVYQQLKQWRDNYQW